MVFLQLDDENIWVNLSSKLLIIGAFQVSLQYIVRKAERYCTNNGRLSQWSLTSWEGHERGIPLMGRAGLAGLTVAWSTQWPKLYHDKQNKHSFPCQASYSHSLSFCVDDRSFTLVSTINWMVRLKYIWQVAPTGSPGDKPWLAVSYTTECHLQAWP